MRSRDEITLRIIDLWSFRSKKSHKRYIVEVERFSNNFLGLKFYWKGVESSKSRYSLLTHDYEPRTIVMSCIHIMLEYLRNDDCASFGFVAASNPDDNHGSSGVNKRFRFYRRMMLSLFGPNTFVQAYDVDNSIYVLINRKMWNAGHVSVSAIEDEISALYQGDYRLSVD